MIDFPASPTDGQLFTTAGNGVVYKYSAAYSSWLAQNPAPAIVVGGQVVRDITLASPAATIDLFSLGVRMCEIHCWMLPVTNADQLIMRAAVGSTVNAGSVYSANRITGAATTPAADASGTATTIAWSGNISNAADSGIHSRITLTRMGASSNLRGLVQAQYFQNAGSNTVASGGFSGPFCDGVQLYFAGGNIAAGSFVRVVGWP